MNIVLEGADATGKSTLASYLSKHLHRPIIESDGPPKSKDELNERIERFLALDGHICCRHPVVSQMIYGPLRPDKQDERVTIEQIDHFYKSTPLIIYCATPPYLPAHNVKERDTPEHLDTIRRNARYIRDMYNTWALNHAGIIYRIGDDKDRIVAMCRMFDPVGDVEMFHKKFGVEYSGKPRALDFETLQFRLKFMREEMTEYELHADAMLHELDKLTRAPQFQSGEFAFDRSDFIHNLASSLDALIDLMYVTIGTAHLQGFDTREAWRRVHEANMRKQITQTPIDAAGRFKMKIGKPPGWKAPDHSDLVEQCIIP